MKMRLLVILALAASCGPQAIVGTADSNVLRVKVGMTEDQVGAIIGPHQLESAEASSGDPTCRSYEYDETIDRKYVHVYFVDGKLVKASDGHRKFCEFGPDTQ